MKSKFRKCHSVFSIEFLSLKLKRRRFKERCVCKIKMHLIVRQKKKRFIILCAWLAAALFQPFTRLVKIRNECHELFKLQLNTFKNLELLCRIEVSNLS